MSRAKEYHARMKAWRQANGLTGLALLPAPPRQPVKIDRERVRELRAERRERSEKRIRRALRKEGPAPY